MNDMTGQGITSYQYTQPVPGTYIISTTTENYTSVAGMFTPYIILFGVFLISGYITFKWLTR